MPTLVSTGTGTGTGTDPDPCMHCAPAGCLLIERAIRWLTFASALLCSALLLLFSSFSFSSAQLCSPLLSSALLCSHLLLLLCSPPSPLLCSPTLGDLRYIELVDFNPFAELTDSLLFDWSELMSPAATAADTQSSSPAAGGEQSRGEGGDEMRAEQSRAEQLPSAGNFIRPSDGADADPRARGASLISPPDAGRCSTRVRY